jgi:hypothetical protein
MNNGTASVRAGRTGRRVIRLGDTTPDQADVEINGRTLTAWVISEAGYPQSVAAELDAAQQAYLQSRPRLDPLPDPDVLQKTVALCNAIIRGDDTESLKESATELGALAGLTLATPRYQTNPVTWEEYVTKAILLLVPGMTFEEADSLSPQKRNDLLTDLGYFRPPTDDQATPVEAGGVVQRPPEPTPTSSGGPPEPGSVTSTPA